jgi:hypothetical protein
MAKSRTSKRANLNKAKQQVQIETVKTAVDLVSNYVKSWTQTEIKRLIRNGELPIVPLSNGLQVGRQRALYKNNTWGLYNVHNELVETFTSKKSVVLYSLLDQLHRYKTAEEILSKDKLLHKIETDFWHYNHTMNRAIKNRDFDTIDIIASRYYDAKIALDQARNDLEKTLGMNKYLKVWETGNSL